MLFLGVAVVLAAAGGSVLNTYDVYVAKGAMYIEMYSGCWVKLRREYPGGRKIIRTMTV